MPACTAAYLAQSAYRAVVVPKLSSQLLDLPSRRFLVHLYCVALNRFDR